MKVQKKMMYHYSKSDDWKIGDIIIAGQKENPFWYEAKNFNPYVVVDGQKMTIFEMFKRVPSFEVSQNNIVFLYDNLKLVAKEMSLYLREQVFEEIRKEFYPNLPSRQKCLWLCDNEHLDYWKGFLNKGANLLTLELNGDIFCGDDYWLSADTFSSVEYANRARHYWSGEMNTIPEKEYLFYGEAIIKYITPVQ